MWPSTPPGPSRWDQCRPAVDAADMLLLDIKALDAGLCRIICGSDGSRAKALLEYCQGVRKPVWLRHVVVPDYTLDEKRLRELAALSQALHLHRAGGAAAFPSDGQLQVGRGKAALCPAGQAHAHAGRNGKRPGRSFPTPG